MKKVLLTATILLLHFGIAAMIPQQTQAGAQTGYCRWSFTNKHGNSTPPFLRDAAGGGTIHWMIENLKTNHEYTIESSCTLGQPCDNSGGPYPGLLGKLSDTFSFWDWNLDNTIDLRVHDQNAAPGEPDPVCSFKVEPFEWVTEPPSPTPRPLYTASCSLALSTMTGIDETMDLTVTGVVSNISGPDVTSVAIKRYYTDPDTGATYEVYPVNVKGNNYNVNLPYTSTAKTGSILSFTSFINRFAPGSYKVKVPVDFWDALFREGKTDCSIQFDVCPAGNTTCKATLPTPTPTDDPICNDYNRICKRSPDPCKFTECQNCSYCRGIRPPLPSLKPLCDQLGEFQDECEACQNTGIWTAIGCVPTNLSGFISKVAFGVGLGIAGGIAFLYFLYGAFLILTSGGVAERVAEGREIIISALIGLLFMIFSVFLLKVIGVDILRIPGFS